MNPEEEKNLTKNLYCIQMRSGIELWIEKEKVQNLQKVLLLMKESKFIEFEDGIINTADITGIYPAQIVEESTRRKNGQWKDFEGNWHNRGDRICPKHPQNVLQVGKRCGYCN